MGYYRSLYVGPYIEVEPKRETRTYFGCPTCKAKLKGEKGLLFPVTCSGTKKSPHAEVAGGDVVRNEPRKPAYEYANAFEGTFPQYENAFHQLQRHCGQVRILLSPDREELERDFTFSLEEEPCVDLDEIDIEAEKAWMQTVYAKEIEALMTIFESVKIGWGMVVDGS